MRIFEYGGPMIHAKTLVADGWWSKVGSTNLNFSSLAANWEIDLVDPPEGHARHRSTSRQYRASSRYSMLLQEYRH